MSITEKEERHQAILGLISDGEISSHEELGDRLRRLGHRVTQATLSRDLRELGVVKTAIPDGGFQYKLLKERVSSPIQSMALSGAILVIHTESGMAPAVAYRIDDLALADVLGTVAGEDTLIAILSEKANAKKVQAEIKEKVQSV